VRRGELSRERVLAAGLALLERDGESALSMRRVAAELGTAPMSLYRHVQDKADLVDGVIALALAELSTAPSEGADWAERACAWMQALRAELNRHPAVIPLLRANPVLVPAVLAQLEGLLEDLEAAGIDSKRAARAAWEMLWFTLSFVLAEQPPTFAAAESRTNELPKIAKVLPDLLALSANKIFEATANHLTKGIREDLRGRS
jgi:AcrR family transcriptional regulator